MVKYRSLYNVDVEDDCVYYKDIPADFNGYINTYLRFALENNTHKTYSVRDVTTQVVNCIAKIVEQYIYATEYTDEVNKRIEELAKSISLRLLEVEKSAQERVAHMHTFIKKGSLVQALLKVEGEPNRYTYIVAKVEHSEWISGDSLKRDYGFPGDKKNVWKSAVFHLEIDDGQLSFKDVKIYLDNPAKYWHHDFLEVVEQQSDSKNTKTAFEAMDGVLKRKVKVYSERDYFLLRNALIQKMKIPQLIKYDEFVRELIEGYIPDESNLDMNYILQKLLDLPNAQYNGFDREFISVPEAVTAKRRTFYPLVSNLELSLRGDIENAKQTIVAETDPQGTNYLKVRCDDMNTFRTFSDRL